MDIISTTQKNKDLSARNPRTPKNNIDVANKKNRVISLRINTLLYDTLHNYLVSAHNVSDYTFNSISDMLRHILEQLEDNKLRGDGTTKDDNPNYIEITIRVNQKQKEFWAKLPDRNKRKILEKGIVSFSKQRL